jgi:NAD(P)H-hydrate epimerase
LLAGSEPLYDADGMRALDVWAIDDQGVEGILLMEQAGRALADAVVGIAAAGDVIVLCGGGNNGGDGYVAARILRDSGRVVHVVATTPPQQLTGDAATAYARLQGDPPVDWDATLLADAAVVVDALLGTGATGAPRGVMETIVDKVNACDVRVVAADVPTGVDASTGEVAGSAVRADVTVTFAAHKLGLWVAPGKQYAGNVIVGPLPYPGRWPLAPSAALIGAGAVRLVPARGASSTKFTSGHVVVAGGSAGLSGAPILAAGAAMRAGAGYVTVAVPSGLVRTVDCHLLEAMPLLLPGPSDRHTVASANAVLEQLQRRGGSMVLGPGLGEGPQAREFVLAVLETGVPTVVDADGLNAIAPDLELLAERDGGTVLTPHAGELARLMDVSTDEIEARRLHYARAAATASGAVVVLKGDDTIVVEPAEGRIAVSRGGAPGLATAGTGDVLAGTVGAFLSQQMHPYEAASAAVVVHAEAGRRAAASVGGANGVIASDVVAALPDALEALRGSE